MELPNDPPAGRKSARPVALGSVTVSDAQYPVRIGEKVTWRLLDDLVCPQERRRRDRQARRLGGLEVDHQSNFVGSSTGRSPGLAPLRILSTWTAARRSARRRLVGDTRGVISWLPGRSSPGAVPSSRATWGGWRGKALS